MMTTADIGNMLFTIVTDWGIPTYQGGNTPIGKVDSERVVIHVKSMSEETEWEKCFADINTLVPDIDDKGTENLVRLAEVEAMMKKTLRNLITSFETDINNWCSVQTESVQKMREEGLKCAYINVRVLVERLNV